MNHHSKTKWLALILLSFWLYCPSYAQSQPKDDFESNYENGLEFYDAKDYNKAIMFLERAYQIGINNPNQGTIDLGDIAFKLSESFIKKRAFDTANNYSRIAIEKARASNIDSVLLKRLDQSVNINKELGEFDNAISTLTEIEGILVSKYGEQSEENAQNLLNLSSIYTNAGNYNKAIEYNKLSTSILEKIHGPKSLKLSNNLSALGRIYTELGNYNEAVIIQDKTIALFSEQDKINFSGQYGFALFMKAYNLDRFNEKEQANELYFEVKKIFDDPEHEGHIASNGNIGLNLTDMGDYENAMMYLNMAIEKTSPSNILRYRTRMQNLAFLYVKLGDYEKAKKVYSRAKNAMIDADKEEHQDYGQLLNNIGKMYRQMGDLKKAEPLFKEALTVFLKTYDENHIKYGYQLNDYANTLFDLGRTDEAMALFEKNVELLEKNGRTELQEYANWQFNLGQAYNRLQQYDKALPLIKAAVNQTKSILGDDHVKYGQMLKGLGQTYLALGDEDNAISAIDTSNQLFINEIDKVFRFRSEKEKRDFMTVIKQNFDEIQSIPYISNIKSEDLNEINLNNQLLLKGLLLNNSKGLIPQLRSLNDQKINSKIQEYNSLRSLLSKTLSQSFEERNFDVDSLKKIVNEKEVTLVKLNNKNFGETVSFKRNWKDSRDALKPFEVAVEFVNFDLVKNGKNTDSTMYCAYIYKKKWASPKLIPLFENRQLTKLKEDKTPNQLYNSEELYELVWKPLQNELKNTKVVYFAPAGILNQISFGALKSEEGILSNQYELVQLSSTALLKNDLAIPKPKNALFVGGINYEYTETVSKALDSTAYVYLDMESIKGSRSTRNRGESWKELPGSLIEIETLGALISKQGDTRLLKGKKATETQFKRLSGKSPNILHIATHGFFYENLHRGSLNTFGLSTEDRYRLADDPLLRSGLILAGANYAWKNGSNPMEEDDGILTAMEISNLDLSNTQMVVLSACETGLGDIDGSEGVYGLQRAFKMAGVDIIVMSLWQVPDKETAEFMLHFYNQWLELDDIRKAFNNTQQYMQQQYPEDPINWAAFVLFE